MSVLIVVESCFGNTMLVARAIASGLAGDLGADTVAVLRALDAPAELPAGVELLVVGAPTHDYSMPKEQTRRQAAKLGAEAAGTIGVREWIERVGPRADLRVATFDTSIRTRFAFGSATKAAAKALKRRGFPAVQRGPSFYVTGTAGPLADGEAQRAEEWGRLLAGGPGSGT